ncbi:MAG: hypothetical protein FWE74_00650 [Oscillospiraceae bacterium]|nr:hypothetical protein [Oscillospiraceae bacterium]
MKKSKIIACFLCLFIFVGCGGSNNNGSLIGEWTVTENDVMVTFEFKEDVIIERMRINDVVIQFEGTYRIEGDKIIYTMTDMITEENRTKISLNFEIELSYSIKGNKLTLIDLIDGIKATYTRTK